MIRRREYRTREMLSSLPKEVRSRFLSLDPAERQLLMNGSDEEREQYGWLPPAAAKRFAALSEPERLAEAKEGWRARRLERKPPPGPAVAVQPQGWQPVDGARSAELFETSARVAETARDIFELPHDGLERVQSMAVNYLQSGADEEQALDGIASYLIDDVTLPACEPAPSRMQRMFGAGNALRG